MMKKKKTRYKFINISNERGDINADSNIIERIKKKPILHAT
jgi:hypothetical protein